MPNNKLTLAVAGSGKTERIVRECAAFPQCERILVLTYTRNNQGELRSRLAAAAGRHTSIEVLGWFGFLIARFARPFLPYLFPGKRVLGFDFDSPPQRYAKKSDYKRYFNPNGEVRRVHLPELACLVESKSGGAGIRTLERLYDRVYIDEVQDLAGYDLEVLALLLATDRPVTMVGDVRQAVLSTNYQEPKNKQYRNMSIWRWFLEKERRGDLCIEQLCSTWRCHPDIASFADGLFSADCGFDRTTSLNCTRTHHDGVFLVREDDVEQYVQEFHPQCLRYSKASAKTAPYEFLNYKESKGLSRQRVLIWPTKRVEDYLRKGTQLDSYAACELYVAITRARQSVAFVVPTTDGYSLPVWSPALSLGRTVVARTS